MHKNVILWYVCVYATWKISNTFHTCQCVAQVILVASKCSILHYDHYFLHTASPYASVRSPSSAKLRPSRTWHARRRATAPTSHGPTTTSAAAGNVPTTPTSSYAPPSWGPTSHDGGHASPPPRHGPPSCQTTPHWDWRTCSRTRIYQQESGKLKIATTLQHSNV